MRTRVRSKWKNFPTDSVSFARTYDPSVPGYAWKSTTVPSGGDAPAVVEFEKFIDEVPSNRHGVNYCHHIKGKREVQGPIRLRLGYDLVSYESPVPYLEQLFPMNSVNASVEPTLTSDLTERLFKSIADANPTAVAAQSLPFIVELRRTISMIRKPWSFLSVLAKNPWKASKRLPLLKHLTLNGMTATSGGWLSYRYGWKPLLSDIVGAAEALVDFKTKYEQYLAHAGRTEYHRFSSSASGSSNTADAYVAEGYTTSSVYKHQARCYAKVRIGPARQTLDLATFTARRMGLDAGSLLTTAWEVIPFSFVVDWFLPVGDVLNKVTSTPINFNIDEMMYTYTTELERKVFYNNTYWLAGVNPPTVGKSLLATENWSIYTRDSRPMVYSDDSPLLTNTHALDAVALIVQQLKWPIH